MDRLDLPPPVLEPGLSQLGGSGLDESTGVFSSALMPPSPQTSDTPQAILSSET